MKLTIKELAPYLPYGLKYDYKGTIYELHTLKNDTTLNLLFDGKICKPILRPLSNLTKEIEINGLKVIAITELLKDSCFNTDIITFKEQCKYEEALIFDLSYRHSQILLSFHFDIFGLIEKNLAIDINTLKS